MKSVYRLLGFVFLCTTLSAADRIPIDQVPMYGGMDRSKERSLRKADEQLIANGIKGFGSRETAAKAWFETGMKYYLGDNLEKAMQRFNQAWLLNPNDPHPFWGFAMVLHDKGKAIEAETHLARAFELSLRESDFLADYGRVATLCTVEDPHMPAERKAKYLGKSDEMYALAEKAAPNSNYLFDSWASALYWRGDYAGAWQKVAKAETLGSKTNPRFLALLNQKMPRPAQ